MRAALEFLHGLAWAASIVAAFLLLLFLSGCANGVVMTEEETIACRDVGCTPWTEGELKTLVDRAIRQGYRRGWTDALTQSGRGI